MKFKKFVLLLLVLSLVSIPIFAVEVDSNGETVAVVGAQEISSAQLEQYANLQQLLSQVAQTDQAFAQLLSSTDQGEQLLNEYKKIKLDELIDETVLQIEAEKQGISLTQDEKDQVFNNHIQQIKVQNGMTDEQISNALNQQGIESLEQYKQLFLANSNLQINKLLEEEVFSQITVTDQEAEEMYNNNQEQINQPFSEVKEVLKNNIRQQKQQLALSEFLDEAKENIDIERYL